MANVRRGFIRRTNVLVTIPEGKRRTVVDHLRERTANDLTVISMTSDKEERKQRLRAYSRKPGCFGFYGCVTTSWAFPSHDGEREVLWTFCEPGTGGRRQAERLLSEPVAGLRFSYFPGWALMRGKYDPRTTKDLPSGDPLFITVHVPEEDWEASEEALPHLGKKGRYHGRVELWGGTGTYIPFPESTPHKGKPGQFCEPLYQIVSASVRSLDSSEPFLRYTRKLKAYESPVAVAHYNMNELIPVLPRLDERRELQF